MPTRSKGCRVCVRRHIRCDLTRPTCLRCRNSGLECDGYAAQWIDETERTATRFTTRTGQERTRSAPRTVSSSSARPTPSRTSSAASIERRDLSRSASRLLALRLTQTTSRCYPVLEDVPLSPSAYTDDVYCTFFLDSYFSFGFHSGIMQGNRAWIFDTLQAPSSNPVANLALRSLIRGFFGRVHRDQELKVEASRLYSEGLIALRDLISVQLSSGDGFDLLAATILLLQYECLANTTKGGFIKHARGLQIVIANRGPQYFRKNKKARCVFAWSKHHVHIEALRSCERSFLERAEWQAVLADDVAAGETYIWASTLSEIAMSISGLFEDVKLLKDEEDVTTAQVAVVEDNFNVLIERLTAWWENFCSEPSRLPIATQQLPFECDVVPMTGTFLRFTNLVLANTFCRYHAYLILITAWLRRLRQLRPSGGDQVQSEGGIIFDEPVESPEEAEISAHLEQIQPYAMAICDALPYFSLPQHRHIGALLGSFPARVAWQALPRGSEEPEWLKDALETMSEASGFELIRNICRPLD